jgi:hypothetical protein
MEHYCWRVYNCNIIKGTNSLLEAMLATALWAVKSKNWVWSHEEKGSEVLLFHSIQTCSSAHPIQWMDSFPKVKQMITHLHLVTRIDMSRSYVSTPYIFMAWCLLMNTSNFIFAAFCRITFITWRHAVWSTVASNMATSHKIGKMSFGRCTAFTDHLKST